MHTQPPGRIQKLDPLYKPIITPIQSLIISHMVLGDLMFRSLWGLGMRLYTYWRSISAPARVKRAHESFRLAVLEFRGLGFRV